MGAAFSLNPFGSVKDTAAGQAQPAPARKRGRPPKKKSKAGRPPKKKSEADISRRSRRIAKSNPRRVIFPTKPKSKTPSRKKFPLTPKSRKKAEANAKPILHRKSPRQAKHKQPGAAKGGVVKFTPSGTYEADEPVFVKEKGVMYEAKVLKRDGAKYFVHYLGYKHTSDKWIAPSTMMKVDATSRRLYRENRGELSELDTWGY